MSDDFQTFAARYAAYGYPLLFAGVLLESAGVPLPGETAVLAAGFLASPAGGGRFDIFWVIGLTTLAAMLGDNLGYEIGRRFARPRLQSGRRFFFLTPAIVRHVEGYFDRYGTWTIFFGRFIAALRVAAALAAGAAGMPWPRFFVANAAGALTWATVVSLLGYFFGNSLSALHKWFGRGSMIFLGSLVLLVGLPYLLRRLRKLPAWEPYPRAQLLQGLLVAALELVCIALLTLLAEGHHGTRLDDEIAAWVAAHRLPALDVLFQAGTAVGTFPAVALVVGVLIWWLWARPWPERAVLVGVLAGSEALGWLVIGLLRHHHVEVLLSDIWPFGFAGVVPLRALAVFGMATYLMVRIHPSAARWTRILCGCLVLWTGLSVLWFGTQTLTETLLEYAAGGLVLFGGIRWLEGHAEPKALLAPSTVSRTCTSL